MKIYPTLNLQNGRVVSTTGQGEPCLQTPVELAERLIEDGATRLALVDVDAAMGHGNNRELIGLILRHSQARGRKVCIQVAGGIRSSDQAQFFIDLGATWLVAGTILLKSPMVSEQLMARFQSFLTAAIDARAGQAHRSGWLESDGLSALDLALRAKAYGFKRLLFVDIPGNAAVEPDFHTAQELVATTGLPLIMGGSLSSLRHLKEAQAHPALKGALVDALLFQQDPKLLAFLQGACA